MSESEGYSVQEGISRQKRKRKNSEDEKDAAELKRESSSGSDESATGEDREDKETDFSIPLAAKKKKEEETSLAKTQTNHSAAMTALGQQKLSSYRSCSSGDFELMPKEEGEGMGGGERDNIESSQEVSEAEWVLVDKPAEDDKSPKLSANTRQDSLAELTFTFQRPAGHTTLPKKLFKMPQGHEMNVFVEYGQDDCTIKVEAKGEKKQERNWGWPLEAKIVVLLHPQKDKQGQLMEGERCEGPGKQLCSLKVCNILIKSMGFVGKDGMMNITLILKYA